MGLWFYLGKLGLVLMVVWASKSFFVYRNWNIDQMTEDIKGAPMPLNTLGVTWFSRVLESYTKEKKDVMLLHTAITLLLAVGFLIQFTKYIRANAMFIHRWVGRLTLVVALLSTPIFAMLIAGLPMPIAQYSEYPIVAMLPYFAVTGWIQIRNKQVQEHKASMIMFASCFFYFGVQRLVMMAMGPLHSGPWAKYTPLGPWENWKEREYEIWFNGSIVLSFPLTFGVAVYNAYIIPAMEAAAAAQKKNK